MGMMGTGDKDKAKSICECCLNEVDAGDIGQCEDCGMDGLCSDCQEHSAHENMIDDGR